MPDLGGTGTKRRATSARSPLKTTKEPTPPKERVSPLAKQLNYSPKEVPLEDPQLPGQSVANFNDTGHLSITEPPPPPQPYPLYSTHQSLQSQNPYLSPTSDVHGPSNDQDLISQLKNKFWSQPEPELEQQNSMTNEAVPEILKESTDDRPRTETIIKDVPDESTEQTPSHLNIDVVMNKEAFDHNNEFTNHRRGVKTLGSPTEALARDTRSVDKLTKTGRHFTYEDDKPAPRSTKALTPVAGKWRSNKNTKAEPETFTSEALRGTGQVQEGLGTLKASKPRGKSRSPLRSSQPAQNVEENVFPKTTRSSRPSTENIASNTNTTSKSGRATQAIGQGSRPRTTPGQATAHKSKERPTSPKTAANYTAAVRQTTKETQSALTKAKNLIAKTQKSLKTVSKPEPNFNVIYSRDFIERGLEGSQERGADAEEQKNELVNVREVEDNDNGSMLSPGIEVAALAGGNAAGNSGELHQSLFSTANFNVANDTRVMIDGARKEDLRQSLTDLIDLTDLVNLSEQGIIDKIESLMAAKSDDGTASELNVSTRSRRTRNDRVKKQQQ